MSKSNDNDNVLSAHIQDCIVHLCITNVKFLQTVRSALKLKYFQSRFTRDFIRLSLDYYDKFKEPIGRHFNDELIRFFDDKKKRTHSTEKFTQADRKLYVRYAQKIQTLKPPNVQYIIHRTNAFIRVTEFELGLLESVNVAEKGDLSKARQIIMKHCNVGVATENIGVTYADLSDLDERDEEFDLDFVCKTGIDRLDYMIGGLHRGRLYIIAAIYKGGKSFICQLFAKQALLRGKKVLHISHELSEKELKERYDQIFGSLTLTKEKTTEIYKWDDDAKRVIKVRRKKNSIHDMPAVLRARKAISRFGGELRVKKFPMHTATMDDVRSLLDELENFHGFIPDLLINDYPDVMAGSEELSSLDIIVQENKGIADERNIPVIVPSQINNVPAVRRLRLDMDHLSGLKKKSGHGDVIIGMAMSEEMQDNHQMLVKILASRRGWRGSSRQFIMGQNFEVGGVCSYTLPFTGVQDLINLNVQDDDEEEYDYE